MVLTRWKACMLPLLPLNSQSHGGKLMAFGRGPDMDGVLNLRSHLRIAVSESRPFPRWLTSSCVQLYVCVNTEHPGGEKKPFLAHFLFVPVMEIISCLSKPIDSVFVPSSFLPSFLPFPALLAHLVLQSLADVASHADMSVCLFLALIGHLLLRTNTHTSSCYPWQTALSCLSLYFSSLPLATCFPFNAS